MSSTTEGHGFNAERRDTGGCYREGEGDEELDSVSDENGEVLDWSEGLDEGGYDVEEEDEVEERKTSRWSSDPQCEEVWALVSGYLEPEEMGKLMCVCRSTAASMLRPPLWRIRYERRFGRVTEELNTEELRKYLIPWCGACVAQQKRERRRKRGLAKGKLEEPTACGWNCQDQNVDWRRLFVTRIQAETKARRARVVGDATRGGYSRTMYRQVRRDV